MTILFTDTDLKSSDSHACEDDSTLRVIGKPL